MKIFKRYFRKTPTRRLDTAPAVDDERLRKVISELYKDTDTIPGGTAGAVRHEHATGKPVGGRRRDRKARERIMQLRNISRRYNLSSSDRAMANDAAIKMTEENMAQTMVDVFPELREPYEELLAWWKNPAGAEDDDNEEDEDDFPGNHVIYGDIFTLHIVSLLNGPPEPHYLPSQSRPLDLGQEERREHIKRAFDFLEGMLLNGDIQVVNVATVTVLEHLQGTHELLALAEPHFGPATRIALKELQEHWKSLAKASRWSWPWKRRRR